MFLLIPVGKPNGPPGVMIIKKIIMNTPAPDFYIRVSINGDEKDIRVKTLETTDGIPYYACFIGEEEITQLRKEIYGKWEQLWGDLDSKTIAAIGARITEKTSPPR